MSSSGSGGSSGGGTTPGPVKISKAPARRIRGIRTSIPSGFILGRTAPGEGEVHLIPFIPEPATQGSVSVGGGGVDNTHGIPKGGTTGQVLTKASDDNYKADWEDSAGGHSIPAGGSTGQVLTKISGTSYDVDWETPSGGSGGGVLPLVNGDLPGPSAIADDVGQFIGVPL